MLWKSPGTSSFLKTLEHVEVTFGNPSVRVTFGGWSQAGGPGRSGVL